MNTARIIRGGVEKMFGIFRNMHSATLVNGDVVELLVTGDTPPTGFTFVAGQDIKQSSTTITPTVCGVISAGPTGYAVGEFCMVQTYGFHPAVKTNAAALAVDVVVTAHTAGQAIVRSVAALGDIDDQELGVCIVTGASNLAGIFIKCM